MNSVLYARRRVVNRVFLVLSVGAAGFGLLWLGLILFTLITEGVGGLSFKVFTETTPPPGSDGGLINAIAGSLVMSLLAVLVGTPIGVLAGTYLAEYGRHTRLAGVIRFFNDILLSAPSIVIGLFIYEIFVINMGHFSALAGAASLAVIVIPVVVRTTENMLLLVPSALREAATALGAPMSFVIRVGDLARGARGHRDGRIAGGRAHFRRNRAAAVHRVEQSVLEFRPQRAHGEPARRDLPICDVAL